MDKPAEFADGTLMYPIPLFVRIDKNTCVVAYWDREKVTGYSIQTFVNGIGWVVDDSDGTEADHDAIEFAIHRHITGE